MVRLYLGLGLVMTFLEQVAWDEGLMGERGWVRGRGDV